MNEKTFALLLLFKKLNTINVSDISNMGYYDYEIDVLANNHLITNSGANEYSINEKGYLLTQNKSYSDYLESLQLKEEKRERKVSYDYQISKFQAKSKFFPYIVSLASFLFAVFAYFRPLSELEIKKLLKDEIVHTKGNTSTSNQTKRADSLYTAKIQTNTRIDSLKN